jgi:O-antigen/teichoic acid export membrane protein
MKLSDQAAFLMVSKGLTALILFVQGPILARMLSMSDYGTFLQINILTSVLVTMACFGLPQTIYYFVPQLSPEKQGGYVLRTIHIILILTVIGAIIFYVGKDQVGEWMNNPGLSELAILIIALTSVTVVSDHTESILLIYRRTIALGIILPVKGLLRVSATVIPLLYGFGLKGVLCGLIFAMLGECLILYGYLLRDVNFSASLLSSGEELVARFHYATPMALTTIASSLGASADKFVVSSYVPLEEFAVYTRGAFEFPLIGMISALISDLLLTRFVGLWVDRNSKEMVRLVREGIRRIACVFYPVCFLCWVVAPQIITLLFTDNYSDAAIYFRIYLLLLLFQVGPCNAVFRSTGDTKSLFAGTLVKVVGAFALSLLFVRSMGLYGAAFSIVAAHVLSAMYVIVVSGRRLGVPWLALVPWKDLLRVLAVSGATAIAVYPLASWSSSKIITLTITGGGYAALFVIAAATFRVFSEGDIAIARRWLSRISIRIPLRGMSGCVLGLISAMLVYAATIGETLFG